MAGVKESQQGPRFRDAINEAARKGINTEECLYNHYMDRMIWIYDMKQMMCMT